MQLSSVKVLFVRPEFGLLVIRVSVGALLAYYGLMKFMDGQDRLVGLGKAIENVGIPAPDGTPMPLFFGIMAAAAELAGGVLLVIGFLFRPAAALLVFVMAVATATTYGMSEGDLTRWGHPLIFTLVLLGLLFTGPGRMSIQKD
ncbi:MAG: DoxX family protein [Opitutales bacterium]|nr:DoxX family protein [Opitutales bacterium]